MSKLFDLSGKTAAITGGGGVLCGGLAKYLAAEGVHVAVLDLKLEAAENVCQRDHRRGRQGRCRRLQRLQRQSVELAHIRCEQLLGRVDILINGAGGNHPMATTGPDKPFFDLPVDAFEKVMDLNILGTMLPSRSSASPWPSAAKASSSISPA